MKKSIIFLSCALLVASLSFLASDVYSKRGGFSSGSFKSSSRSYSFKSSRTSRKAPVVRAKAKPVSKKHTKRKPIAKGKPTKQRFDKSKRNSLASKSKVATSKQAFANQQSKFKKRSPVRSSGKTSSPTTRKPVQVSSSHKSWSNSARTSNSRTYHQRRGRYYDDWSTPSYAYNSYSSFGMWDSMALWYMVSQGNSSLYYHHMNTPGMIQWRHEASSLSRDNADLRKQLATLDASVAKLETQGVSRNPDYVPEGVDRDVLLSAELIDQSKPELRWCTGALDKNYHAIGSLLANKIQSAKISIVAPTVGTSHNLQLLDKRSCDGALVQRDGYVVHLNNTGGETKLDYKRVLSPYQEVVHLVCNLGSGVENLTDLRNNKKTTVFVGNKGSGSSVTWSNLVAENEDYASVRVEQLNDANIKLRLAQEKNTCMVNVSGLGTKFMKDVLKLGKGKLELVEWDDSSLEGVIDPNKKKVYNTLELPSDTYPSIQVDNTIGFFNTSTNVATVPADMIINNRWIKENPQVFAQLEAELSQLSVSIVDLVSSSK